MSDLVVTDSAIGVTESAIFDTGIRNFCREYERNRARSQVKLALREMEHWREVIFDKMGEYYSAVYPLRINRAALTCTYLSLVSSPRDSCVRSHLEAEPLSFHQSPDVLQSQLPHEP